MGWSGLLALDAVVDVADVSAVDSHAVGLLKGQPFHPMLRRPGNHRNRHYHTHPLHHYES